MSQPAVTCAPETSIAIAGGLMEDRDHGFLPVVDIRRRLLGVVTDRDLLLSVANNERSASQIHVYEAMKVKAATCSPDDDLKAALELMRQHSVRRLPVVDRDRHVIGVLSIDDVVRWGVQPRGVSASEVIQTLEWICERRAPPPQELEAS
jgi:CBS domain-containing protein